MWLTQAGHSKRHIFKVIYFRRSVLTPSQPKLWIIIKTINNIITSVSADFQNLGKNYSAEQSSLINFRKSKFILPPFTDLSTTAIHELLQVNDP